MVNPGRIKINTENETTSSSIRILIVDDHPAVRQGLALLLAQEGICVCAEADGCKEALDRLAEAEPDLAIIDLSLGSESGLSLVADLHALGIPSLVYSMYEENRYIQDALSAGAMGYVTKRELHGVLVEAIHEVAAGQRYISPNASAVIEDYVAHSQSQNSERQLSDHEAQVFRLLGNGEGTIEIASAMHISTRTVESYYMRIMEKLDIKGMHNLRRYAINFPRNYRP